MKIPIEISNRHIHLSKRDMALLFSENYKLKILKKLSQPGEFAAEERVTLINGNRKITDVRVLGPEREETQVELLEKDLRTLGINPPIRNSGDLADTPGIIVESANGRIKLKRGVIISNRHLHITREESAALNLKNNSIIKITVQEKILDNVVVRINPNSKLAVHINKDDEFAQYITKETYGDI